MHGQEAMTAVDQPTKPTRPAIASRSQAPAAGDAADTIAAGHSRGTGADGEPAEPWWIRHRLAILGSLLVAVLLAGAVAVHQHQQQQDRLAAVEGALATTRADVRSTEIQLEVTSEERVDTENALGVAHAELAELEAQLEGTESELGATVADRDEVLAAVEALIVELGSALDGVRANVERVELQGDQVAGLGICLDGVNMAMNRQAVGNQLAAAAVLSEVADTCDLAILSVALSLEDAQ